MQLEGRSIIITGASAGIGRALAERLAAEGAHLTLASRSLDPLEEVAAACRARGGKAIAVATDVVDADACGRMVARAVREFGGVDMLVNNAGIGMVARFDQITELGIFERLMQVNYLGSVYCTWHALPHLKASRGLICAVSSLTGKTGVPTRTGYAASKHAMQGFFDSLRVELRNTGVDVLVVSPGFVATDIRTRALGPDSRPLGASPREESRGTMSVAECTDSIVRALHDRRRELVMTAQGKVGQFLRLLAPRLVDRMVARATDDPGR
jgi:short-subunit dehydrogenase